ncbi:hypothetical protein [Bacillus safensis]|uniref:hypothetical protein n=1 Tax=Bacillus safensis TaxID=561879 RepID=UPI002FFE6AC5
MNTYVVSKETEGHRYLDEITKQTIYAGSDKQSAFDCRVDVEKSRLILDVWFNGRVIKSFSRSFEKEWVLFFDQLAITKHEIEDYREKLSKAQETLRTIEGAKEI